MLTADKLHGYQRETIKKIISNPKLGLFLGMGLGKTVITLSALVVLLSRGVVSRALLVAPIKVASTTWDSELDKWEHLKGVKLAKYLATDKNKASQLASNHNLLITNREQLKNIDLSQYDFLILDESTLFKSGSTDVYKRVYKANFSRVLLLTATPTANSIKALYYQIKLLDKGERLGRTMTSFNNSFGKVKRVLANKITLYSYEHSYLAILEAVKDITYTLESETAGICIKIDYIDISTELSEEAEKLYKVLKRDRVLELPNKQAVPLEASSLVGKFRQLTSGFIFHDNEEGGTEFTRYDSNKTERLKEVINWIRWEGYKGGILVAYNYIPERLEIMEALPEASLITSKNSQELVEAWNSGACRLLIANPRSTSHGLNLQKGGSVVIWYSMTYDYEHYTQLNGRLARQGQQEAVKVFHLLADNSIDRTIKENLGEKFSLNDLLYKELG